MPHEFAITVALDRVEECYPCQARIGFIVQVTRAGEAVEQGSVQYVLRHNMVAELERGSLGLSADRLLIYASLDEPGFVDCSVTFEIEGDEPVAAVIGAAVEPLAIKPSMPVPDDFDAFWASQLARLAEIPLSSEQTSHDSWDDEIVCFDTRIPCVDDVPVSGYFARPKQAAAGTLPAILTLHGAGVHSAGPESAIVCAQRGWLAMNINAHGIANSQPAEFYQQLAAGELADYRTRGQGCREEQYFVGMFLRVRRALDFLCAQAEWDGRVLVTHGHSQGGFQSVAGAALDARVSAFSAGVPAGCDHTGYKVGRPNGWPKLATSDDDEQRDQFAQAARYIDGVNFAQRTKAEAFFSVGALDGSCNPVGVYAAYNSHAGPKRMIHQAAMGHAAPPEVDGAMTRYILEHAKRHGVLDAG